MDADSLSYIKNLRDIKEKIKARLGIRSRVRHKSLRAASAATVASSIVATRVFKGNVILDRFTQSLSKWSLIKNSSHLEIQQTSRLRSLLKQKSSAAKLFVARKLGFSEDGLFISHGEREAATENLNSSTNSLTSSSKLETLKPTSENSVEKLKNAVTSEIIQTETNHEVSSMALKLIQSLAIPIFGNVCHLFMHGLNKTQVFGAEKLIQAVNNRSQDQPLITVCNHVAALDDPLVLSAILHPSMMMHADKMRWTMCATDRCFTNPVTSAFFHSVKVLPVERGAGVHQKGMDYAVSKLNAGEWVHIFPEGSRSRDGGRTIGSIKRGVGRLVADCDRIPLLLPFIHSGMDDVLSVGKKIPKIGKKVSVMVGDPIEVNDIFEKFKLKKINENEFYAEISTRVSQHMIGLKERLDAELAGLDRLEKSHAEMLNKTKPYDDADNAESLIHFIDWENQHLASNFPFYLSNYDNHDNNNSNNSDSVFMLKDKNEHRVSEDYERHSNKNDMENNNDEFNYASVSGNCADFDSRNIMPCHLNDIARWNPSCSYHHLLQHGNASSHNDGCNHKLHNLDDKMKHIMSKLNYVRSYAFREFASSFGFAAKGLLHNGVN